MGTKLQYMTNVLATSSPNSSRLSEKAMEDWDYFKNKELKVDFRRTCIDKLHSSMDRILEQNNVETIKKTMLKHEDVFKHQVQELHRVYSVQKMLMREIKQTRVWRRPRSADVMIRHHLPLHTSTTAACGDHTFWLLDQDDDHHPTSSSRELELITKGGNQRGLVLPTAAIDKQPPLDCYKTDDPQVELTLSIGTTTSAKRKQPQVQNHPPNRSLELLASSELTSSEIPDLRSSSSASASASFKSVDGGGGDECSDPAATTEDYRKQPHWLFQGLSLNRTQL